MTAELSSSPTTSSEIRLYVSPLDPALLPAILPPHLQQSASGISYHAPQTFPEKAYGYINLPAVDAQKLKSKLHGAILRGLKMRVEEARPEKRHRKRKAAGDVAGTDEAGGEGNVTGGTNSASDDLDAGRNAEKLARKERRRQKRRSENGVLEAVELPEGRSVKRGWAQQTDGAKDIKGLRDGRKERGKDGGRDKGEMLFRTSLPPNAASMASSLVRDEEQAKKDKKKSKASEPRTSSKRKRAAEVKEFDNTTRYLSFLRDSKVSNETPRATEFLEGKGWVDDNGNVVETIKSSSKRSKNGKSLPSDVKAQADQTVSPDGSDEKPSKDSDDEVGFEQVATPEQPADKEDILVAQPKPIHPLEALFKRPTPLSKSDSASAKGGIGASRPAPIKTSFSFFSSEQDEDESEAAGGDSVVRMAPPQTPFTRQDMEMRGIRSAAPTPDTAAIGKRFKMPWGNGDTEGAGTENEDEDEEEEWAGNAIPTHEKDSSPTYNASNVEKEQPVASGADEEQNEFEKHFWQHRGEYNRAWKARKREARKEVRQSENRKRGAGGK